MDLFTEKSRLLVEWFNKNRDELIVIAERISAEYNEAKRVYELELARMKEQNGITREWNRVHQEGFEIMND